MPTTDPAHWLYRLDADGWLQAARGELAAAERALGSRQQRAGVTQARRAAGMAWNAVLVATRDETGYGRSYMDHLQVLARDASAPALVQQSARALVEAPLAAEVIQLGRGDTTLAGHAAIIVAHVAERLAPPAHA